MSGVSEYRGQLIPQSFLSVPRGLAGAILQPFGYPCLLNTRPLCILPVFCLILTTSLRGWCYCAHLADELAEASGVVCPCWGLLQRAEGHRSNSRQNPTLLPHAIPRWSPSGMSWNVSESRHIPRCAGLQSWNSEGTHCPWQPSKG